MHTLAYRMFMSTPNYNISFSCLETGSSCVILREITQWVLHATSVDELSRFDDKQLVKHTIYYFAEQQISDTKHFRFEFISRVQIVFTCFVKPET